MAGRKAEAPPCVWSGCGGASSSGGRLARPIRASSSLWAAAVRLAGRYGLSKTASTLGVNYQGLKRRLAGRTAGGDPPIEKRVPRMIRALPVVNLIAKVRLGLSNCRRSPLATVRCSVGARRVPVGVGGRRGAARMRICLRGVGMPDLPALGRSFWDRRAMIQITPQMRVLVAIEPADSPQLCGDVNYAESSRRTCIRRGSDMCDSLHNGTPFQDDRSMANNLSGGWNRPGRSLWRDTCLQGIKLFSRVCA